MNTEPNPLQSFTHFRRTEYGHTFLWKPEKRCWESVTDPTVLVFPGLGDKYVKTLWRVYKPNLETDWQFAGKNAENSAFRFAGNLHSKI